MNSTAIIIAGGKSKRMKVNKAFLEFNNKPMIEIIIDNLKDYFTDIILVTNEKNLYNRYDLLKVSDLFPGEGPLSGIHAGLKYSKTDNNFVVACDMPYISGPLAKYIVNLKGTWDVAVPKLDEYYQPLYAAYKKSCIPYIEQSILNDEHKLTSFYKYVNVSYIFREEILKFGEPEAIFSNINTPEDYKNLLNQGRKK